MSEYITDLFNKLVDYNILKQFGDSPIIFSVQKRYKKAVFKAFFQKDSIAPHYQYFHSNNSTYFVTDSMLKKVDTWFFEDLKNKINECLGIRIHQKVVEEVFIKYLLDLPLYIGLKFLKSEKYVESNYFEPSFSNYSGKALFLVLDLYSDKIDEKSIISEWIAQIFAYFYLFYKRIFFEEGYVLGKGWDFLVMDYFDPEVSSQVAYLEVKSPTGVERSYYANSRFRQRVKERKDGKSLYLFSVESPDNSIGSRLDDMVREGVIEGYVLMTPRGFVEKNVQLSGVKEGKIL